MGSSERTSANGAALGAHGVKEGANATVLLVRWWSFVDVRLLFRDDYGLWCVETLKLRNLLFVSLPSYLRGQLLNLVVSIDTMRLVRMYLWQKRDSRHLIGSDLTLDTINRPAEVDIFGPFVEDYFK